MAWTLRDHIDMAVNNVSFPHPDNPSAVFTLIDALDIDGLESARERYESMIDQLTESLAPLLAMEGGE